MSLQKDSSSKQEKSIQRQLEFLGAKLVPASGGTKFDSGDVRISNHLLIECKTVTKRQISFSIREEWLSKVKEQAFEQGISHSCVAFRFKPDGDDNIVIPLSFFKELLDVYLTTLGEE